VRIIAAFLCLIAVASAAPPTSVDLHARYGKPDVERFAVRPDVTLTVEYGEGGQACAMRIEPRHAADQNAPDDPLAEIAVLADVLNEVVPPATRGKQLDAGERISGQCNGAAPPMEYENVSIYPYYGICEKQPKERGVEVRFKRPTCEAFQPRRIPAAR
jgi:hypothetical protein